MDSSDFFFCLGEGGVVFLFFFESPRRGVGYTREIRTICYFGVFPCFIVFFASKLAIFPSKRGVLGA